MREQRLLLIDASPEIERLVRQSLCDVPVQVQVAAAMPPRSLLESLEQDRAEVLEMIAADRPPAEVVRRLVDAAERLHPHAVAAAVVLFDGVLHLSDGRLPDDLKGGINRHLYTFAAEFCSNAADREPAGSPEDTGIVVSNLLEHRAWEPVRDAVRASGLRTCWSALICSVAGMCWACSACITKTSPPLPMPSPQPCCEWPSD
jgi:hypothetical protein